LPLSVSLDDAALGPAIVEAARDSAQRGRRVDFAI
jgi:hypothetical protein